MINNLLIIGCGLIGSSILRASSKNKIAKNIFVKEKSITNIKKLKKIKSKFKIVENFKNIINELFKIKPPFNVNKLAQLYATEALKDKKFAIQSLVQR